MKLTRTGDDCRLLDASPEAEAFLSMLPGPAKAGVGKNRAWAKRDGDVWIMSRAAAKALGSLLR